MIVDKIETPIHSKILTGKDAFELTIKTLNNAQKY